VLPKCYSFHGLDPLTCSELELASETMNPFRNFGWTLGRWTGPSQAYPEYDSKIEL